MQVALSEQEFVQPITRTRRFFSDDDKRMILQEAQESGMSMSAIAKKHGLTASQLFKWRVKFYGSQRIESKAIEGPLTPSAKLQATLMRIDKFENEIMAPVFKRTMCDLKADRLPAHQASCALANLGSAFSKITALKLAVFDQLEAIGYVEPPPEKRPEEEHLDYLVEREAERVLLHLVKHHLLPESEEQDDAPAKAY